MMKNVLSVLLGCFLCGGAVMVPVWAQTPPPSPSPSPDAARAAELQDILPKLNLTPRQKISVMRIMRDAKASGQDKAVTAEQIGALLTPDQKKILMDEMMAKAAEKKAGQ